MSSRSKKKDKGGKGLGRPSLGTYSERMSERSRLLHASDRVLVTDFLSYGDYLLKLYETVKSLDPSYSYSQLSEDLGFSRSNVIWLVITGRRRLTPRATSRIVDSLHLTGANRRYFELLQRYVNARRTDDREALLADLTAMKGKSAARDGQKELEYYSEWQHPIIRELVGLEDFSPDPHWINERLVIPLMPMQILKSLKLLESLDLIIYDRRRGRHVQTGGQIRPDREVERLAAIRFHQKMCDMAREAVTRVEAARREMNTITLALSDEAAMQASEILYHACEKIMKLEATTKSKDQIYQINVHLFPFTRRPQAGKSKP